MKGATAIVNVLKEEGVEFISTFPAGGSTVPIINACADAGIRTILARQERVAVNIADGFTRVSNGSPNGVSLVSSVGMDNAFSGISQAFSDLVPVLVLAESDPTHRVGARPIQNIDLVQTCQSVTKWVEIMNYPERVPELMRRAFTYLRTGRPSPVVLGIPSDLPGMEFPDEQFSYRQVKGWRSAGDPHDVKVAAKALLAAKNPVIYAGEGVLYAQAWDELKEFAELLQVPVMTSMKGKSCFPENHPLALGHGGFTGTKAASLFLRRADLLFCIGASLTIGPGIVIPEDKTIVQINSDEWDVNNGYLPDYVVIGDAKLVLRQLCDEAKREAKSRTKKGESLKAEIKKIKDEFIEEFMPLFTSNEKPINPYRIFWDLMHTVDVENTIITHEAGQPRNQLLPVWEAVTPRGYIGWGHHSTMGWSLGGAMGAKLARPESTVINVMGDGAFGMTGTDFETAAREKIPIMTVVLNNFSLGAFKTLTPSASILSGDYAEVGEALGGYGERVEEPDEVIPAVRRALRALDSNRPALLEFTVKYEATTTKHYHPSRRR